MADDGEIIRADSRAERAQDETASISSAEDDESVLLGHHAEPVPGMTLVQAVCGVLNEFLTLIFVVLLALKLEGHTTTIWLSIFTPLLAACVIRPALSVIRIPFMGSIDVEEVLRLMWPKGGSTRKLAYFVRIVENLLLFCAILTLGIHLDADDPPNEGVARDAFFVLLALYLMLLCTLLYYHVVSSIRGPRPAAAHACTGPSLLAGLIVLLIAAQYCTLVVKLEQPELFGWDVALLPLALCVLVGAARTLIELMLVFSLRADAVDDDDRTIAIDAIGYIFFGVFFVLAALRLTGTAQLQWPIVFAPVFAASLLDIGWLVWHELAPLCHGGDAAFEEL